MTIAETLMVNKELTQNTINLENFNIDEELTKYDEYEIYGYNILIRLFIDDNTYAKDSFGRKTSLLMPETALNQSIYTNVVGLIVKMGSECFKAPAFKPEYKYPGLGNWVLLRRGEGLEHQYNNMPMKLYEDHALLTARVKNPQFFRK